MLMPWWDELTFFLFFHLTCSKAPWCSKELFQHKLEAFTDWEGDRLTNWENDSQVHGQTPHVSRPLLSWVKHVRSPGFVLCTWDMRNTAYTSGLVWSRDEAECQCWVFLFLYFLNPCQLTKSDAVRIWWGQRDGSVSAWCTSMRTSLLPPKKGSTHIKSQC